MQSELNSISQSLLKTLFTTKKDFKYYELFFLTNKLSHNIPNIDLYTTDLELTNIMTFMERNFEIPMLQININTWLKEDKNNNYILDIYNRLSNLRSL